MALLSKEEEQSIANVETRKIIETIINKRKELEKNTVINEYLKKLLRILEKRQISSEDGRETLIELLRLITKFCRNKNFYQEIGICEDGLTLDSMEDICLLDERNRSYKNDMNRIISVSNMRNFEINGRDYSFTKDNRVYNFRRLLSIREIQGLRLLLLYSQIVKKKKISKCHEFNSGFSTIYPKGDLVTGNIVSPFKNVFIAHSWIEIDGRATSPNLNFSQSTNDYYETALARDMVRIPFKKLEEDYRVIMQTNPTMEFYDYLRNPDETMAKLK